jgi:hypothetical protein
LAPSQDSVVIDARLTFRDVDDVIPMPAQLVGRSASSFGVIAGRIVQESGRSLPGARVRVTPVADGLRKPKRVCSLARQTCGEFAIRVPTGSMRYNVKVEARGFEPAEKQVQMEGDQRRVEIFF